MPDYLSDLIVPKKLSRGDKVALVTSSWGGPGTFPWKYEKGKQQLEAAFGVECVEMPFTRASDADVYAHPERRAADLMEAFRNPEIKGIISTIGGDDSLRMLPFMDFDVIRQNPKVYLGFSDSTVTHFMCLKAGVRSYYGPSVMAGFAENGGLFDFMRDSVQRMLFESEPVGLMPDNHEGWVVAQHSWADESLTHTPRTLLPMPERRLLQGAGRVRGRLIGGCMDVLEFMKGTSLWPAESMWEEAVLFFETSEDAPSASQVTYWLRNYATMGILHKAKAILVGRPGGTEVGEDLWQAQEDAFVKVVKTENQLDLPILTRMDFGHTDPQMVLPYGCLVEVDCEAKQMRFLEVGCL